MQILKTVFTKESLFLGTIAGVHKCAIYWLLALVHCAYSETLNGANVEMELAGDWILYSAGIMAVMGVISLVLNLRQK